MLRRSGVEDVEEDQIPNGLVPGQAYSARKEEFGRKGLDLANSQGERSSGSLTKRNRPSLNYKPLIVADDMSDYSPPSKTRARRYAKLRKEGREKEALEAAIGFYHSSRTRGNSTVLQSDVRTEATDGEVGSSLENQQYHPAIIRGMEPSSPLEMEASPTPAMKTVPKQTDDQREDDDPGDDMDVVSLDGDDQPSIEDANQHGIQETGIGADLARSGGDACT